MGPAVHLPGSQQGGHCWAEDRGQRSPSAPSPQPAPPHGAPETGFPLGLGCPIRVEGGVLAVSPALSPATVGACWHALALASGRALTPHWWQAASRPCVPGERSREAQAMCAGAPQSSCCTPPPSQGTGGSRLGVPGLVLGVTWDREGGCLVQRWTVTALLPGPVALGWCAARAESLGTGGLAACGRERQGHMGVSALQSQQSRHWGGWRAGDGGRGPS